MAHVCIPLKVRRPNVRISWWSLVAGATVWTGPLSADLPSPYVRLCGLVQTGWKDKSPARDIRTSLVPRLSSSWCSGGTGCGARALALGRQVWPSGPRGEPSRVEAPSVGQLTIKKKKKIGDRVLLEEGGKILSTCAPFFGCRRQAGHSHKTSPGRTSRIAPAPYIPGSLLDQSLLVGKGQSSSRLMHEQSCH